MDRLLNSEADDAVQSSEETLRQTEVYDEIREKTSTILSGRNQGSDNVDEKVQKRRCEFKAVDFSSNPQ